MSREEIEGRVRNEIQREINHETWRGLHLAADDLRNALNKDPDQ